MLVSNGDGVLPLMESAGVIQFLGDGDLTDYHSPLGTDTDGPVDILASLIDRTMSLDLDSLPGEAAVPMADSLARTGLRPEDVGADDRQGAGAAVVDRRVLLDDRQEGAPRIAKKAPALRRTGRTRRLCTQMRKAGFGFDEFVRLHRLAPGRKGTFMTGERHRFFCTPGPPGGMAGRLPRRGGAASACLFGWTDGSDYYLYNSSFDPSLQAASPGLVSVDRHDRVRDRRRVGRLRLSER